MRYVGAYYHGDAYVNAYGIHSPVPGAWYSVIRGNTKVNV
mgnify:CR=1 FL=1